MGRSADRRRPSHPHPHSAAVTVHIHQRASERACSPPLRTPARIRGPRAPHLRGSTCSQSMHAKLCSSLADCSGCYVLLNSQVPPLPSLVFQLSPFPHTPSSSPTPYLHLPNT